MEGSVSANSKVPTNKLAGFFLHTIPFMLSAKQESYEHHLSANVSDSAERQTGIYR